MSILEKVHTNAELNDRPIVAMCSFKFVASESAAGKFISTSIHSLLETYASEW